MNKKTKALVKRLNTLVNNIQRMELTPYQFDELVQISNTFNTMYEFDVNEGNHMITYTEFAEIVGLSKYSTTIYLSHFNFARFRIETRKGYDNMVKINEEFVAKMCEYLYLKRKFEAMKNLKSYYLDKLKDL